MRNNSSCDFDVNLTTSSSMRVKALCQVSSELHGLEAELIRFEQVNQCRCLARALRFQTHALTALRVDQRIIYCAQGAPRCLLCFSDGGSMASHWLHQLQCSHRVCALKCAMHNTCSWWMWSRSPFVHSAGFTLRVKIGTPNDLQPLDSVVGRHSPDH